MKRSHGCYCRSIGRETKNDGGGRKTRGRAEGLAKALSEYEGLSWDLQSYRHTMYDAYISVDRRAETLNCSASASRRSLASSPRSFASRKR